jgi:arginyl-tRNA synthetase
MLSELRERFRPVLATLVPDPEPALKLIRPRDGEFDYQCNFCMMIAKQIGATPRQVAAYVAQKVDLTDFCDNPTITP